MNDLADTLRAIACQQGGEELYQSRIEWKAADEIERLRATLDDIRHTLDEYLGDTDPLELEGATDEDIRVELPVYWCCQQASLALREDEDA